MNIASLQAFLRSQAGFLASAAAPAKLVKDVEAFADSLTPFASFDVEKVAEILRHANHHRETGEWLPILTAKKASTRKPAAPKVSNEDLIREASQRLDALYAQALDPGFRFEAVETQMAEWTANKKLTAALLTTIARDFGLIDIPKQRPKLIEALGRKIKGRREFHDNTQVKVEDHFEGKAHATVN